MYSIQVIYNMPHWGIFKFNDFALQNAKLVSEFYCWHTSNIKINIE